MKPELRTIKYGSEEYIAIDTKDLLPFEVTVKTSRHEQLRVSYRDNVVTIENRQPMKLIHFEDGVSYVPVYGNYNYHKNVNFLDDNPIFTKLCLDNSIRQAFVDRLKMEYPEVLL